MADDFPSQFPATAIDSYTTLTDNTDNVVANHPNARGSAITAVQTKVGVDNSAVTSSHDYKLVNLPAQSGNWDAGSIEIRAQTFESDVATNTAPFTVASTTVVTNLNADKVDGKDAPTGDIVGISDSQTLTNKTLTSPDINTGTFNGTIDGNWTAAGETCADLGTVTTADINGGTIDGVTIGGASAPTVTDLGSVATCDINGGTIDGVTIGGAAAPTVTNLGSVTTCDINGGTVNGISSLGLSTGADINEISTDGTFAGNSDTAVPTEKATKTYVDANSGKSSTIFSFAGCDDKGNGTHGYYVGTTQSPNISDSSNNMYSFWAAHGSTYRTVIRTKFEKISGIDSVTFYAKTRLESTGSGETAYCQVTIDSESQEASALSGGWISNGTPIDVSGLSDGTVYDVTVEIKSNNVDIDIYLSSIIAFGS